MWFDESVIYQIYPLGLCGAPRDNDGVQVPRVRRVLDWIEHIQSVGADTVLFNPLFESDRHGTTAPWIAVWGPMRISSRFAARSMPPACG